MVVSAAMLAVEAMAVGLEIGIVRHVARTIMRVVTLASSATCLNLAVAGGFIRPVIIVKNEFFLHLIKLHSSDFLKAAALMRLPSHMHPLPLNISHNILVAMVAPMLVRLVAPTVSLAALMANPA